MKIWTRNNWLKFTIGLVPLVVMSVGMIALFVFVAPFRKSTEWWLGAFEKLWEQDGDWNYR